ncbi:SAM-dependent methyltransferase [Rhodococcus xishaensis]|uniref:S-adenosyl-L-methionine-dependent methyltransferase n=1 Tax=Rhodococcus xishaensis TaxID=2487364 RepID=A0A3S3BL61_9NOCA|nr:SAM-dependent methyltransferase [Rhodococcus xishaensis]RVW03896.1 SAM-dependent methyltransferase [Rhodococcus xishaensis]
MNELAEWDIVTGVGITALAVAAGRAIETDRDDGLVSDPYAEAFVEAAAPPRPMPTRLEAVDEIEMSWGWLADYIGVRSRYFDDYFAEASRAGIDQIVLLAAGLDVRAYRLDWPTGTTVYELDAPKVLAFKDDVLAVEKAGLRADRRALAVDLREDWAVPLQNKGFDRSRPSAWLAEGLLPFLPNAAKERLVRFVTDLSAPGSRLEIEHVDDVQAMLQEDQFQQLSERFGIDMAALWPEEDDFHPAEWLTDHGWDVEIAHSREVAERFGRTLQNPSGDPSRSSVFITAVRQ